MSGLTTHCLIWFGKYPVWSVKLVNAMKESEQFVKTFLHNLVGITSLGAVFFEIFSRSNCKLLIVKTEISLLDIQAPLVTAAGRHFFCQEMLQHKYLTCLFSLADIFFEVFTLLLVKKLKILQSWINKPAVSLGISILSLSFLRLSSHSFHRS